MAEKKLKSQADKAAAPKKDKENKSKAAPPKVEKDKKASEVSLPGDRKIPTRLITSAVFLGLFIVFLVIFYKLLSILFLSIFSVFFNIEQFNKNGV